MIKFNGRAVRIISQDTEPSCYVWIVYLDNPDQDDFVLASDLIAE